MDLLFIILLLVCGMALIVLELVAIPGTTIAGLAGVGLSIWGIYRVFVEYGSFWGGMVIVFDVLVCLILLIFTLKSKLWKRFAQKEEISSKVNEIKTVVNVGDRGKTITRLAPMGTALINNERMEVYTSTSFLDPETEIVVEEVSGSKIRVNKIN
ncbi:MAG: NfeD family protein [Synergistales bacterium]|jgi:membrane-bound ClpP family serine protease|nr:NfeD family protein [Bacteroidales bacterium]MDY6435425.1 NfeD family protein [Synergistales bacterium]MDY6393704.1 NfeD family protein [Bacteroidales bacterium]MDY6396007.1 NfeD family protein [Bacteroidales bacterium]MDY6403287.1 NfeD family protein [Bacteroidales bacterium]